MATDDFFQKNMDNVYMTSVTKIYRELLGYGENNFIYPEEIGDFQLLSSVKGRGKAFMLKRRTTETEWKSFINKHIKEK